MELTKKAKAWLEGIKAYENKKTREDNPYSPADLECSSQWLSGYEDAAAIIQSGRAA